MNYHFVYDGLVETYFSEDNMLRRIESLRSEGDLSEFIAFYGSRLILEEHAVLHVNVKKEVE